MKVSPLPPQHATASPSPPYHLVAPPRRHASCNQSISALDPPWSGRYLPAAFQPLSLAKLRRSGFRSPPLRRRSGRRPGGLSTIAEIRSPNFGLQISER